MNQSPIFMMTNATRVILNIQQTGHLNDNEFNFFTLIHLFMIGLPNNMLIHIHSELISSLLDLASVIGLGRVSLVSDS